MQEERVKSQTRGKKKPSPQPQRDLSGVYDRGLQWQQKRDGEV